MAGGCHSHHPPRPSHRHPGGRARDGAGGLPPPRGQPDLHPVVLRLRRAAAHLRLPRAVQRARDRDTRRLRARRAARVRQPRARARQLCAHQKLAPARRSILTGRIRVPSELESEKSIGAALCGLCLCVDTLCGGCGRHVCLKYLWRRELRALPNVPAFSPVFAECHLDATRLQASASAPRRRAAAGGEAGRGRATGRDPSDRSTWDRARELS